MESGAALELALDQGTPQPSCASPHTMPQPTVGSAGRRARNTITDRKTQATTAADPWFPVVSTDSLQHWPGGDRVLISAEATAGSSERLGVRRIDQGAELLDISVTWGVAWKNVARRRMQVYLEEAARQALEQQAQPLRRHPA